MKNFVNRCLNEGCEFRNLEVLSTRGIPQVPFRRWEPGCFISIPSKPTLLCQGPHEIYFIVVTVVFPDGEKVTDKLYLGTLTKTIYLADSHRAVFANGTASQFVRQFTNWREAVIALAGKVIEVTAVDTYDAVLPGGMVRATRVCTFDLR